jgi:serine O-acetyltransferase
MKIENKVFSERGNIATDYNFFVNKLNRISSLPFIKMIFAILIPQFGVLYLYRKSKINKLKNNKIRTRFYYLLNYYMNNIDISPNASIGSGVYMPHPIGIVIGANVTIGNNVVILSCTTFGANSAEKRTDYGYPTIGDDCYIGTGAKIIGNINIGEKSIVGANSVVVNSFKSNSKIVGIPGKVLNK